MAKKTDEKDKVLEMVEIKPVTKCKPCGSQVLLELLTLQEMMGIESQLVMPNSSNAPKPKGGEYQAIVLDVGPSVVTDNWGFKVGDRVILSGTGVPAPDFNNSGKDKILMEPHCVKGVLS